MIDLEEIRNHKKKISQEILDYEERGDLYPAEQMVQALACEDTDLIPKVPDAGKVFEDAEEPYQLMHNGVKILKDAYSGKYMTDLIRGFRGHHEPQEEKVFHEVLKFMPPGAVMIELGSYWAYYSLWFAKQVAQAKNYLIEPSKTRLELTRKHFVLNEEKGIFFNASIGVPNGMGKDHSYVSAPQLDLDDVLKILELEHVNIVHADIQASESYMLKSAEQSIAKGKIDYFFISTHDVVHTMCLNFLKAYGYSIIAEHTIEEGYMPDGLIVAKRKGVAGPDHVDISKVAKGQAIWDQ